MVTKEIGNKHLRETPPTLLIIMKPSGVESRNMAMARMTVGYYKKSTVQSDRRTVARRPIQLGDSIRGNSRPLMGVDTNPGT